MINEIKGKIRSRTGASLTFALLIFLVCAVVGSAVLVAGTAASGRMSKIAEMDQRYYSVNSAARLLIELIDGEETVITKAVTKTTENNITVTKTDYLDRDGKSFGENPAFDTIQAEAAYYFVTVFEFEETASPITRKTSLNLRTSKDELAVSIQEELIGKEANYPYGAIVLTVENAAVESANDKNIDKYAMKLVFNPDIKKTIDGQNTTWKIAWNLQNAEIVGGNMRVK